MDPDLDDLFDACSVVDANLVPPPRQPGGGADAGAGVGDDGDEFYDCAACGENTGGVDPVDSAKKRKPATKGHKGHLLLCWYCQLIFFKLKPEWSGPKVVDGMDKYTAWCKSNVAELNHWLQVIIEKMKASPNMRWTPTAWDKLTKPQIEVKKIEGERWITEDEDGVWLPMGAWQLANPGRARPTTEPSPPDLARLHYLDGKEGVFTPERADGGVRLKKQRETAMQKKETLDSTTEGIQLDAGQIDRVYQAARQEVEAEQGGSGSSSSSGSGAQPANAIPARQAAPVGAPATVATVPAVTTVPARKAPPATKAPAPPTAPKIPDPTNPKAVAKSNLAKTKLAEDATKAGEGLWRAFCGLKTDEKLNMKENVEKILKKFDHDWKIGKNKFDAKSTKMQATAGTVSLATLQKMESSREAIYLFNELIVELRKHHDETVLSTSGELVKLIKSALNFDGFDAPIELPNMVYQTLYIHTGIGAFVRKLYVEAFKFLITPAMKPSKPPITITLTTTEKAEGQLEILTKASTPLVVTLSKVGKLEAQICKKEDVPKFRDAAMAVIKHFEEGLRNDIHHLLTFLDIDGSAGAKITAASTAATLNRTNHKAHKLLAVVNAHGRALLAQAKDVLQSAEDDSLTAELLNDLATAVQAFFAAIGSTTGGFYNVAEKCWAPRDLFKVSSDQLSTATEKLKNVFTDGSRGKIETAAPQFVTAVTTYRSALIQVVVDTLLHFMGGFLLLVGNTEFKDGAWTPADKSYGPGLKKLASNTFYNRCTSFFEKSMESHFGDNMNPIEVQVKTAVQVLPAWMADVAQLEL